MSETSKQLSEIRREQRARFLAARFPGRRIDESEASTAPAIDLQMSAGALEACLRHMAASTSQPLFEDEACLEVLSAADFLGLPALRTAAAARAMAALTAMDRDAVESIPRALLPALLDAAPPLAWEEASGAVQLAWLLGDDDAEWRRACERRWRGQQEEVSPPSTWRSAFVTRVVQAGIRKAEMAKLAGESVSSHSASAAAAAAQGIADEGIVESLSVTRAATLTAISRSSSIARSLKCLDATGIEDEQRMELAAAISFLPRLTSLCLRGTKLRKAGMQALADALLSGSGAKSLVQLNVSDCAIGVDACEDLGRLLRGTPKLQWLDASCNQFYCSGAEVVAAEIARFLPALKVFAFNDCKLSDAGIAAVTRAVSASSVFSVYIGANLESKEFSAAAWHDTLVSRSAAGRPFIVVELGGRQPLTSARSAELASRGRNPEAEALGEPLVRFAGALHALGAGWSLVHKVALDGVALSSSAAAALGDAARRGGVRVLSLSGCKLCDASLRRVLSPRLLSLNISGNPFAAPTADAIAGLLASDDSELAALDVSGCGMTDRCSTAIFRALSRNASLTSLACAGNGITGRSETMLASMLASNETLTFLNVSWCDLKFGKLTDALQTCTNSVLFKLDVGHNSRGSKLSKLLSILPRAFPELREVNVSQSQWPGKAFGEQLSDMVRRHPSLENLALNASSMAMLGPLMQLLQQAGREKPKLRRLFVRTTPESAPQLASAASSLSALAELGILCSRAACESLAPRVNALCPTRITLVPADDVPLEWPTWVRFPPAPFPTPVRTSDDDDDEDFRQEPCMKRRR